jgi:pyrroline-5-carboxylate reductase
MKTAFVGGGVMGEAILSSGLQQGVLAADDVLVCEKIDTRRDELATRYRVAVTDDVSESIRSADMVVLAVKPQDLGTISGTARSDSVVVSIMAGVRIETISTLVGHNRIVRVMPNTPVSIQRGMSTWTATPAVTDEQRETVKKLLSSIGEELYVDGEAKIDMATAISGSGPAYVFLFIEALIDAGVHVGMTRAQSETLALQTVRGAAEYAIQSGKSPAELRAMVSSPGGTTVAGLRELERHGLRAAITDCVEAAYERARELGGS